MELKVLQKGILNNVIIVKIGKFILLMEKIKI